MSSAGISLGTVAVHMFTYIQTEINVNLKTAPGPLVHAISYLPLLTSDAGRGHNRIIPLNNPGFPTGLVESWPSLH